MLIARIPGTVHTEKALILAVRMSAAAVLYNVALQLPKHASIEVVQIASGTGTRTRNQKENQKAACSLYQRCRGRFDFAYAAVAVATCGTDLLYAVWY
eukprot:3668848-Rhodomonas_salina.1